LTTLPLAVNWHFWPWCNYGCKFCFANFSDIPRKDRLSREEAMLIPPLLAKSGATKITFVGGEPTLCPYLGDLLEVSKNTGLTTCIVSNGTGLTKDFLDSYAPFIDWVGISIDASSDLIHTKIGRGLKSNLANNQSNHLSNAIAVWKRCQDYGIQMKLNTVVCKDNLDDDMLSLVLGLRPDRWKIFEVLPVEGQNDGTVDDLLLGEGEFKSWVDRHSIIQKAGITFVPESNELMRGSYAMLDALGRFYSNMDGGHVYGLGILEVGVETAWSMNNFSNDKFIERGGVYSWDSNMAAIEEKKIAEVI
jgi:radical S-adenosyl methionine domain-containing protein 2